MASLVTGEYLAFTHLEKMQRQATFDNEYMDFTWNDMHQKAVGDDPAPFGYPDDGNGIYTKGKGYPDWYFMNVARR